MATLEARSPDLDNFFMAGQWVVPGGGVIPTLVSGKHAAMLLCRRDGKAFSTSSKESVSARLST